MAFTQRGKRTETGSLIIDPCPECGIAQDAHWACRSCSARCHIIPRSETDPTRCAWCVADDTKVAPAWLGELDEDRRAA